jgi:hypothetical protein
VAPYLELSVSAPVPPLLSGVWTVLLALLLLAQAPAFPSRDDTLAVLRAVEKNLFVARAKPGAEGHLLIVQVAPALRALEPSVSETLGSLCAEGARVIPDAGIASVEIARFELGRDTAVVQIKTTSASGTSGTNDLWKFNRDPAGRWKGVALSNNYWDGQAGTSGRGPTLRWCRGTDPGVR